MVIFNKKILMVVMIALNKENFLQTRFFISFREKFLQGQVFNPKPQDHSASGFTFPTCPKYGRSHGGKCLVGIDICYGCGKVWHKVADSPIVSNKGKDGCP